MAHLESKALGGYYPFPMKLIGLVGQLVDTSGTQDRFTDYHGRPSNYGTYSFLDPCAGDGEAVIALARELMGELGLERHRGPKAILYSNELEGERANELARALHQIDSNRYTANRALQGDAFRIRFKGNGVSVVLLNPPYDQSKQYGREEHRWLMRWTEALTPGTGILAYVVPHYALEVSAAHIAKHYSHVYCYRFPGEDFEAFKQVVMIGVRADRPSAFDVSDSPIAAQVRQWASNPESIPELTLGLPPVVALQPKATDEFDAFEMTGMNIAEIQSNIRPWQQGTGTAVSWVSHTGLKRPLLDLIGTTYNVAAPLRPAHIAEALAAGVLNSQVVKPDDKNSSLPPILVKGVYEKSQVIIEEKKKTRKSKNRKQAEKKRQLVTVQQPVLRVAVLDMESYQYHYILPGNEPSGATSLEEMNIADVLQHYGMALAQVMKDQCPPLHDPTNPDHHIDLPVLARPLWSKQEDVAQTALKLLYQGDNPFVLGEVGTGKTSIACALINALSAAYIGDICEQIAGCGVEKGRSMKPVRNALVMPPPHLIEEWEGEIKAVLPGARVFSLEKPSDVLKASTRPLVIDPSLPGAGITIMLLSREKAKLGHAWTPGHHKERCPGCGTVVDEPEKAARHRAVCTYKELIPLDDTAKLAQEIAHFLGEVDPDHISIKNLVRGRIIGQKRNKIQANRADLSKNEQIDDAEAAFQRRVVRSTQPLFETPIGRWLHKLTAETLHHLEHGDAKGAHMWLNVIVPLLVSLRRNDRDTAVSEIARAVYAATSPDWGRYSNYSNVRETVAELVLTMTPGSEAQAALAAELKGMGGESAWDGFDKAVKRIQEQLEGTYKSPSFGYSSYSSDNRRFNRIIGDLERSGMVWDYESYRTEGHLIGSAGAAIEAMQRLISMGEFAHSSKCGTHLYQAAHLNETTGSFRLFEQHVNEYRGAYMMAVDESPMWRSAFLWREPAYPAAKDVDEILGRAVRPHANGRFPLATFIARHHRGSYDVLVLDEAHEYNTRGSAQELAAHRLSEGKLTIILTGTLTNGYASSAFANMWALSRRAFRQEFGRDEKGGFITTYGYRKVLVEYDEKDAVGEVPPVAYGAVSDRIVAGANTTERKMGEAPGILPLFTMKYLLGTTVTIQISDLEGQVIPEEKQHPVLIQIEGVSDRIVPDNELITWTAPATDSNKQLLRNYQVMEAAVMKQIAADRFRAGRSGKLIGALSELPSYFDRAPEGPYEVRYPTSLGGGLISRVDLPGLNGGILPKEQWMLEQIERELAEGRNVLLLAWHSSVITRLKGLVAQRFGEQFAVLRSDRVPTRTRKTWINENVIFPGKRVLISNPVPISTGLNNLIWFNTIIWGELPQVKPIVFRQANGRLVRPGHTEDSVKPVRIFVPVYAETGQDRLRLLLGKKLEASYQADGISVKSSLASVGAAGESDVLAAMHIGQALYHMLANAA